MPIGPEMVFVDSTTVLSAGRELTFFAGNDYHRLSWRSEVREAVKSSIDLDGLNLSASRFTTANHRVYMELEEALADFFGVKRVVFSPSGYSSNLFAFQGVRSQFDVCLIDELAHPSLVDGALAANLPILRFDHRNLFSLEIALESTKRERAIIATDGVFPAVGSAPPLRQYAELAGRFGAAILIDDAHGVGVLGEAGRGSVEEFEIAGCPVIQTGTLSKAFGTYGGFVVGDEEVAASVEANSGAFVGCTPLPIPLAAAALCAVRILKKESSRFELLKERTARFKGQLNSLGFPQFHGIQAILRLSGSAEWSERSRGRFTEVGIYPSFIRYPGGPSGGHFRFTLSSSHSDEELDKLESAFQSLEPIS